MLRPIPIKETKAIKRKPFTLLLIGVAAVIITGWHIPAVAEGSPKATDLNINNYIKSAPKPNYQAEVLDPLHAAQQAKADADAKAAQAVAQQQALDTAREVQTYQAPVVQVTGNCGAWMSQAGISDPGNAMILINMESGCNPNATNRSSGACGIGQQLPCGKWPHVWNDPVGAMIDMQAYVYGRYGSWANAVAHEYSAHWY